MASLKAEMMAAAIVVMYVGSLDGFEEGDAKKVF
jgi:hypothetical protein